MAIGTAAAIGLGVGALGVGAQAYGAHKAGKAAGRANAQQNAINQQMIGLGREQLDWSREIYNQWRQEFDPILERLRAEAMESRDPDYAQISADTGATFGAARNDERIRRQRYGVDPSDGQFGSADRGWSIQQSLAEVTGRNQARRDAENDEFARLASTYGIGANLQSQAMAGVQGGYGMLQGAMGGAAGSYGQQASIHGGNAAAGWAGAWRGLNNMLDTAMDTQSPGDG